MTQAEIEVRQEQQAKSLFDEPSVSDKDSVGVEWNSEWGRQRVKSIDPSGLGQITVETIDGENKGQIRNYTGSTRADVDKLKAEQERKLTPEYAAEQAERAETQRLKAERDERAAQKAAALEAEIDEYLADIGANRLQAGRIKKALLHEANYGGVPRARKDYIDKLIADGAKPSDTGLWKPDGVGQTADILTKTGMDYARWKAMPPASRPDSGSRAVDAFIRGDRPDVPTLEEVEAEGTQDDDTGGQDQGGTRATERGRRDDTQQGDARRADQPLEGAQPEDGGTPADTGDTGRGRVRGATENVADNGRPDSGRDEPSGRQDDRRAGPPDDGTRGASRNFRIDDPLAVVGGGQVARFKKNQAAIELLNTLRDENRQATPEEQAVLAAYTGWGSFGQELFQGTWARPQPKQGWEERDAWLRDHLGQKEWEGMRDSIVNAHYTDPPTVMAMWSMLQRMGFTGGRILEPSMGIGNFYLMMPQELMNRSQLTGIELDPTTGAMAKQLFPDATISIKGYQDSLTPDDFFDVIIGNWPFGNYPIADRRYNRLNPLIHDYFFLKTLDQVRPGGIVIGITSSGSLDKKSATIRREMAKKAELVAAFRLPSGAFEEYAGTKVVTDIVILRKRPEPLALVREDWVETEEVSTPSGTKVRINKYYVTNPQNVIGTINFGSGTTRGRPGMIVERPDDMAAQLERIVSMVPEGAYRETTREDQINYITNHTADREGALTYTDDGLFIVRGEFLAPAAEVASYIGQLKDKTKIAAREDQLRRLVDMRKAYSTLMDAELNGKGDVKAARKALRDQYEAFVKKHGTVNTSAALKYMTRIEDPFAAALAALEVKQANGKYQPAAIMQRSTMRKRKPIEEPNVAEAYVMARNSSVNPSLEEVAALVGDPAAKVKAELLESGAVFELPGGDIVPADIYLAGNVREKLRQAETALRDGNKAMQRNVDALEKVLPPFLPYFKISVQMGATWIPPRVYAQYIADMLNRQSVEGIEVTFINGLWKARLDTDLNRIPEASTGYGMARYDFSKLVNAALSNDTVKVMGEDSDGNKVVDEQRTTEANTKVARIRKDFQAWVWKDADRRTTLEYEYNETRNAFAEPSYDGSFMSFNGMALTLGNGPFNLRKHQVNAIWRALVTRRSLMAHEVGTGKSFTIAGIAVEARRYGLARKPLILGHNANSKTLAADINVMYPGAKVLYVDNLAPDAIDTRLRQIANDDWDAVVLPHSLIDRLAFKEETLMELAQEQLDALEDEARAAVAEEGGSWSDDFLDEPDKIQRMPTAKELVKARQRIIENIQKQAQRAARANAVTFEELGVDMVLVDEAHEFKKPPFATRMKLKGLQTKVSDRSIQLMFMTHYIRAMNRGGNVHLFTGTPITNTLTEVFHMMRYIMAEDMKAVGVDSWDGWFGSFASELMDIEMDSTGQFEPVTRLQKFINVPELRQLAGQYMDVVFSDQMPEMQPRKTKSGKTFKDELTATERDELENGRTEGANDRPYKKVITVNGDMTSGQLRVFQEVVELATRFKQASGLERKNITREGRPESPVMYMNRAHRASFDERLADDETNAGMEGRLPDDPNSKISRAIENIMEIYESSPDATQVVFTDTGLGKTAERVVRDETGARVTDANGKSVKRNVRVFSPVWDMVARLVERGIPRDQIAVITGDTSKEKRKQAAADMNAGRLRLVIGSTDSLGVGVNMQKNLRAMHHLDAPWMPGELEQRNGRGHRQGNQWNTVLEFRYTTDRLDGKRWQLLALKDKFIKGFMRADGTVRTIEGEAAAEDTDLLATFSETAGDPRILQEVKLTKDIEALETSYSIFLQGVREAGQMADRLVGQIARYEAAIEEAKEYRVEARAQEAVRQNAGTNFRIKIGGTTYDTREDAKDAMLQALQRSIEGEIIGQYGGLDLVARRGLSGYWLEVMFAPEYSVRMRTPSVLGLESGLRNLSVVADLEADLEAARKSLDRARQVRAEKFQDESKLRDKQRQLEALRQDMADNPTPPPAWLRSGAPIGTDVYHNNRKHEVTGHRWNSEGWFVVANETLLPYNEVRDEQGMPIYEEREFVTPDGEPVAPAAAAASGDPTGRPWVKAEREPPLDARFRKGAGATGRMSWADVRQVVQELRSNWKNAPHIQVLESADRLRDLDPVLYRRLVNKGLDGATALFSNGTVYIFADKAKSRTHVEESVLHEVIGHYGLRSLLGKGLDPYLARVYMALGKSAEAERIKSIYFDEGRPFDPKNKDHRDELAEELIAHLAESAKHRTLWAKVAAFIRDTLRALGFTLRLNESDILAVLRQAEAVVRDGGIDRTSGSSARFRREAPAYQSPYAEANKRFREEHNTVWRRTKQLFRRGFAPGGLLSEFADGAIFRGQQLRDQSFRATEYQIRNAILDLQNAIKKAYGHSIDKADDALLEKLNESLAGRLDTSLPADVQAAVKAMRDEIDLHSTEYLDILNEQLMQQFGLKMSAIGLFQKARDAKEAFDTAVENSTPEIRGLRTRVKTAMSARIAAKKAWRKARGAAKATAKMDYEDAVAAHEAAKKAFVRALPDDLRALRQAYMDLQAKAREANSANIDTTLFDKMTENLGEYVNRSYKAFDDPKWFKKVDDKVLDAAREYLYQGYRDMGDTEQRARDQAEAALNAFKTGTAADNLEGFIKEGKLGMKDLSVLMRRKRIPKEIRELLGEYKDPRITFAKSVTKTQRLVGNHRFLQKVRAAGMGTLFFEEKTPTARVQFSAEGNEAYAPLDGLWTTPEVLQAFQDAMGTGQESWWIDEIIRLNGIIKYGKTVLSPTTAMRNFWSGAFMLMANGHFNPKAMRYGLRALKDHLMTTDTAENREYVKRLIELGVMHDTTTFGEMRLWMEDSRIEQWLQAKGEGWVNGFRKANQIAQGFYSFGDDFYKIIGFENIKADLMGAGMGKEAAEQEAAKRIRAMYPTYSMVGRAGKWLSRFPLAGTFVSFPAEIIRTSYNMVEYTINDLRSDNPALRAMGAKRAVGMILASGAIYAASALTKAMLGIDDEEEEAIRAMAAPWQKNSTFIFTGRDKNGNLRYFDMSFLDPYDYGKRPLTAFMSDRPWQQAFADSAKDLITPFFGADITAGTIFEVAANKKASGGQVYRPGDDPLSQTVDIANHLRKNLQPGVVGNVERMAYAITETRKSGYGQPYNTFDEVLALGGFRASTLDPKAALFYRSFELNDRLSEARSDLMRAVRDDKGDLKDIRAQANVKAQLAVTDMFNIVTAARTSGLTDAQIRDVLRTANVSASNVRAVMTGKAQEVDISSITARRALRQASVMLGPEEANEMRKRIRELAE